MPLVRINLGSHHADDVAPAIGDVIYEVMRSVAGVPEQDKFQIVTRHAEGELVYPPGGYMGVQHTGGIVFIQVTWNAGRSTEVKRAFYRQVADGIHARTGVRKEDIFINLVDVQREDWSFGNGDMQYVPE